MSKFRARKSSRELENNKKVLYNQTINLIIDVRNCSVKPPVAALPALVYLGRSHCSL